MLTAGVERREELPAGAALTVNMSQLCHLHWLRAVEQRGVGAHSRREHVTQL